MRVGFADSKGFRLARLMGEKEPVKSESFRCRKVSELCSTPEPRFWRRERALGPVTYEHL